MKIYCKCLNVSIECKVSTFDEVDVSSIDLCVDNFFKEGVGTIELVGISKEQPALMQVQIHGGWVVHYCLNCLIYTHALHREKGAAALLVNKGLISDPDVVKELKAGENFSPIFNIVINYTEDDDVFTRVSGTGRHQSGITALHQTLLTFIQRESNLTEERVRAYSDQQYAMLENLRTRAHRDHRSLTKLLTESAHIGSNSTTIVNSNNISNNNNNNFMSNNNSNNNKGNDKSLFNSTNVTTTNSNVTDHDSTTNSILRNNNNNNQSQQQANAVISLAPADAAIKRPTVSASSGASNTESKLQNFQSTPTTKVPNNTVTGKTGIHCSKRYPASGGDDDDTRINRSYSETSHSNLSFDSEVLFPLEGMEDPPSDNYHTDEEKSDTDDSGSHDEGIHIPRRVGSFVYAKSLPVNVPCTFIQQKRSNEDAEANEDLIDLQYNDEDYPPHHNPIPHHEITITGEHHRRSPRPMDIAASMKALAKSVHGDIFDLPRPKYSSQI